MSETLPAAAAAPDPFTEKLRAVLSALTDATTAMLTTDAPDKFARAARLCGYGQKLATEIVMNIQEAAQIRACYGQDMGADYFPGQLPIMMPHGIADAGGDAVSMQRDLMMLLQGYLGDQKKDREKKDAPTRYDIYLELNQALEARRVLEQDLTDLPLLARIKVDIDRLVTRLSQQQDPDAKHDDVVPTELLRGHPSGAGLEPGNPFGDRGPVLHREDRGEALDPGGDPRGHHEEALAD